MTEFRHKIGDCLYDLYRPYEMNDAPDEVRMYPVLKRTDRYVYIDADEHLLRRERRLARFSVADLESEGHASNRPNQMLLYTRPLPDWPLLVVSIDRQRALP